MGFSMQVGIMRRGRYRKGNKIGKAPSATEVGWQTPAEQNHCHHRQPLPWAAPITKLPQMQRLLVGHTPPLQALRLAS